MTLKLKKQQNSVCINYMFASVFLFTAVCALSALHANNNLFKTDSYCTHQPVLYRVASQTTGPIIEFGCGYCSTDMLHEICKQEGRLLITVEDDWEWMQQFTTKYLGDGYYPDNSGWHKFYFVPGKDLSDPMNPDHWIQFLDSFDLINTISFDLCFLDQLSFYGRWETLKRMKDSAKYIVLHDCDFFPGKGVFGKTIKPIVNRYPGVFVFNDVFKYFKVYFPAYPWPGDTGPPTLLGSNFEKNLPEIDFDQPLP